MDSNYSRSRKPDLESDQLHMQGFLKLPRPPPNARLPLTQARLNYPSNQPQKFWYVPEMCKMTKVLEDGRENGLKNQFSIEIFGYKFENFLKNFKS